MGSWIQGFVAFGGTTYTLLLVFPQNIKPWRGSALSECFVAYFLNHVHFISVILLRALASERLQNY